MKKLETIKFKLQEFLNEFENINTPDKAIEKFKEIFKDEYIEENHSENAPYYKSYSKKLYIKDGYGLGIEKVSGPGDFLTLDKPSHSGTNLYIFSELANESISLFDESEKKPIKKDINELYNFDFSTKNLLNINNDYIFNFVPDNIKNKDEIIFGRYENLKNIAKITHNHNINDELISYYGGLDVVIHSEEYYLYESLLKNIKDKTFMKKAIPLFNKDFPNYLNDEINECEYALYIIDHIEDYYEIAHLLDKIEQNNKYCQDMKEIIYDITSEKSNIQIKLDNVLSEYKELKSKKNSILDFIMGKNQKRKDNIEKMSNRITNIQKELKKIEKNLSETQSNYKDCKDETKKLNVKVEQLQQNLEKPFKDFTLNLESDCELYINGKYYIIESLDRLSGKKDYYEKKINELNKMKSYDSSRIQARTIDASNNYEKQQVDIDYDI